MDRETPGATDAARRTGTWYWVLGTWYWVLGTWYWEPISKPELSHSRRRRTRPHSIAATRSASRRSSISFAAGAKRSTCAISRAASHSPHSPRATVKRATRSRGCSRFAPSAMFRTVAATATATVTVTVTNDVSVRVRVVGPGAPPASARHRPPSPSGSACGLPPFRRMEKVRSTTTTTTTTATVTVTVTNDVSVRVRVVVPRAPPASVRHRPRRRRGRRVAFRRSAAWRTPAPPRRRRP